MGIENKENQETSVVKKSKYTVAICYDDKMMRTFIDFYNRVRHPRATLYMVVIGAMLFALPFVNHDIKLPGLIVCYVMGPILLLFGLFRNRLSVHMMKKDTTLKYKEELIYRFGNTGVEVEKSSGVEYMGSYKKIFRMFEDEKHFYVNMNEDDLMVLPKNNFVEGDVDTFKDFILDKSKADFIWKPAKLGNKIKWYNTQRRLKRQELFSKRK